MNLLDRAGDYCLAWWFRSGRAAWSRLRRGLLEGKYRNTALPEVSSLEDIESCLRQITWEGDGPLYLFDCISYPQTTWARKRDDCDGFASLGAELLRRWRPETGP